MPKVQQDKTSQVQSLSRNEKENIIPCKHARTVSLFTLTQMGPAKDLQDIYRDNYFS